MAFLIALKTPTTLIILMILTIPMAPMIFMVPTIPIIHTTMIILKKGVPHGILEDGEDDYMF